MCKGDQLRDVVFDVPSEPVLLTGVAQLDGQPLPFATLSLFLIHEDIHRWVEISGLTDADGSYSFETAVAPDFCHGHIRIELSLPTGGTPQLPVDCGVQTRNFDMYTTTLQEASGQRPSFGSRLPDSARR